MEYSKHKTEEFLNYMRNSPLGRENGFQILAERKLFREFHSLLKKEGFLLPSEEFQQKINDGRVEAPFWPALVYLEAMSLEARIEENKWMCQEICDIATEILSSDYQNFRTNYRLLEIVCTLPDGAISVEVLEALATNLVTKFDDCLSLATFITKLLDQVLKHERYWAVLPKILKVIFTKNTSLGSNVLLNEQYFLADSFWLENLVVNYSKKIGEKIGVEYIQILKSALKDIFSAEDYPTWLTRPAIEDHEQNKDFYSATNIAIIGIREGALGLANRNIETFKQLTSELYAGSAIETRIAIFLTDKMLSQDSRFLELFIDQRIFMNDCIHETYNFLNRNFRFFDQSLKNKILDLLDNTFQCSSDDKKCLRLKYRWLSSIKESEDARISALIAELEADPDIYLPENPDFFSYMTSRWGYGPSPYTIEELDYFLDSDILLNKLQTYPYSKDIFGENRLSLCDQLINAIKQRPFDYSKILKNILEYDFDFQRSILDAYTSLYSSSDLSAWLSSKDSANSIFYCLKLIGSAEITLSELADEDFSNYEWLICSYTDLVRAISRNDNLPFSKENLLQILNHLDKLQRLGWKDLSGDTDKPINLVINSTKGKLIETIIVLSLSICRHVHKSSDDHSNVWSKLTDIYEHLVQEASLEFSALASRYLLQLKYMSSSWLDSHIESILNPKNANAFFFAMDGVAYAPGAPEIFNFLKDTRAIERAITELPYESVARSKLIERIGLAYIWKIESEDSILISQFFDKSHVKDLKFVLDLFWSLSNQQLSPDQMSLILSFWNKSCEFVITNKIDSQEIINVLLKLITYVDEVSSDFYEKYSQLIDLCTNNEAAYFIVKSFDRLHKEFPDKVSSLAANFVDKTGPFYDYESAWLDLTKKILVNQQNKANAFTIMDKLQRERGFRDLYITNI